MVSLHAFLRDYLQFNYSVAEIVERYCEWVNVVTYMILSRAYGLKNEFFAVKCAKRGNDVYRFRVYRRFKGLCSRVEDQTFFNPKERGTKRTRALWVTLTNDTKRGSFEEAWRNIGIEFNRFMAQAAKISARLHVAESLSLLKTVIHISTVYCSSSQRRLTFSGIRKVSFAYTSRNQLQKDGIATLTSRL